MAALKVRGTARVPGDKSISHRALILSALANGTARITDILDSADVQSTAAVLRSLGAEIPLLSANMRVRGSGLTGLRSPNARLDCGNSGTTTRLVAGVAAACEFESVFEGDASLSRRPMKRIADPLTEMGARFEFERGDGLPMKIRGGELRGIAWNTGGSSAQVKSAILLAGLVARVSVTVKEKAASRDHTERMLRAMGVTVETRGTEVRLEPVTELRAVDVQVPGDPSSAAFLVALATLAESGELVIPDICLNPTRTGFFRVLEAMGADIVQSNVRNSGGENIGDLTVRPAALHDYAVNAEDIGSMIDELPLLACVAAAAGCELEISGAEELRVKESDRIRAVVDNLRAIGARAEEKPDGLRILSGLKILRGSIDSRSDHRIAMSFGVLGRVAGNEIDVRDKDCVAISFPDFWETLDSVTT